MQRTPVLSSDVPERAALRSRSLSQWVQDLDQQVEVTPELIGKLYDALHLKHFGRPSRRRNTPQNNIAFGRAFAFCVRREIEPAAFISANMVLLRDWLNRSRLSFQPNMLSGPKAEDRYNGYMRRANSRFRRGDHRVLDGSDTQIGRLRDELFADEHAVAERYVALHVADDPLPWASVAAAVQTGDSWKEMTAKRGVWFSLERPAEEMQLARLRAAWAIAETYRHGLGDSIGFTDFGWPAFAALICRLCSGRAKRWLPDASSLRDARVKLWGAAR